MITIQFVHIKNSGTALSQADAFWDSIGNDPEAGRIRVVKATMKNKGPGLGVKESNHLGSGSTSATFSGYIQTLLLIMTIFMGGLFC